MNALRDLAYPQSCAACRRPSRDGLCADCGSAIKRLGSGICAKCGFPSLHPRAACPKCAHEGFGFTTARQAAAYEGVLRSLIKRFKYLREWSLAPALSRLLEELAGGPAVPVTYVPPSERRARIRGFDHSRLLAETFAEAANLPCIDLLTRVWERPPQSLLLPEQRRANLDGTFKAVKPPPDRVLLVDDVFTTGATAKEASRALLAAGSSRVDVLCIARTLPPSAPAGL